MAGFESNNDLDFTTSNKSEIPMMTLADAVRFIEKHPIPLDEMPASLREEAIMANEILENYRKANTDEFSIGNDRMDNRPTLH